MAICSNFKVNHCCCIIELRIGCIVMAIVGIILSIISVAVAPVWYCILGFIFTMAANGGLLYAAFHTTGTIQSRSIATLIYVVTYFVLAIVLFILTILFCIAWSISNPSSTEIAIWTVVIISYIVTIPLFFYFALVAFSFYLEFKKG